MKIGKLCFISVEGHAFSFATGGRHYKNQKNQYTSPLSLVRLTDKGALELAALGPWIRKTSTAIMRENKKVEKKSKSMKQTNELKR